MLPTVAGPGTAAGVADPRRCEIVLQLLAKKWIVSILLALEEAPRRRQYLFHTLKVSSSRLDPTIQTMTRWGVIERAWIPSGNTDAPGLAITPLGRDLLGAITRLAEWQHVNLDALVQNDARWREARQPSPY